MKKITLSALAAMMMSASSFAQTVTTTYVLQSDKSAINSAIQMPIGKGNTHVVVLCKSLTATNEEAEIADGTAQTAATNLGSGSNTGKGADGTSTKPWTQPGTISGPVAPAAGTLILRSNQTDKDLLPKLQMDMVFQHINPAEGLPSVVFENIYIQAKNNGGYPLSMKTTSYQQYVASGKTDNKNNDWNDTPENNIVDEFYDIDSVVFRNCVIAQGRSIFRQENNSSNPTPHHIKNFIFENNRCYENNPNSNPFPRFYFVSVPDNFVMSNNVFYDMPYAKSLIAFHKSVRTDGTASKFYIYNNTFLLSGYSNNGTDQNFMLFDGTLAGQTLFDESSEVNIYNNLFLGEEEGIQSKPADTYSLMEDNTVTMRMDNADAAPIGFLTTMGNYFSKYWSSPVRPTVTEGIDMHNDLDAEAYPFTFDLFNNTAKNNFTVEKANSAGLFTAGVPAVYEADGETPLFEIPTCVGAPQMYVDKFPVEAEVKVGVTSSVTGYDGYTVTPEKAAYAPGEEVTIVLDAAKLNNNYIQPVTVTWSDGQEANATSRTFTLSDTGIDISATVEIADGVIAAFPYFENGNSLVSLDANVNAGSNVAKVGMYAPVEGAYALVTEDNKAGNYFQSRPAKFGEDEAASQMPVISRRTNGDVRSAVGPAYAVFEFSTENYKDVVFSCYVGTDNLALDEQAAEVSLDGETWEPLASVKLSEAKRSADFSGTAGELYGWSRISATLPAKYANQSKVLVRVMGKAEDYTAAAAYVYNSVNGEPDLATATTFEYIGSILVSGTYDATAVAGVSAVEEVVAAPVKAVENGRIIISKDGKKFTAAGAQVK